jgi:glycosyltransferase involved in cell wall biosynthesis
MKILLGSHGFPPNQTGGAEWEAYRRAIWLAAHGHEVQVITVGENGYQSQSPNLSDEVVDGLKVRRLSYNLDQQFGSNDEFDNKLASSEILKLLEDYQFDIFHLICGLRLTGSVIHALITRNIPIILTLTDFWFLCPRITLAKTTGELCSVPEDSIECIHCIINIWRRYRFPYKVSKG